MNRLPTILALLLLAGGCDKSAASAGKGDVLLTDYAAWCSGDDWAPALLAACREASTVHIPAGRYRMAAVRLPSGIDVYGDGESTVLVPSGTILFRIEGKAGEPVPLSADMADFSPVIPLERTGDFAPGDMVLLQGQRNCMFKEDCGDWTLGQTTAGGRTCFFGEFVTVARVDGSGLVADAPTVFPYYRSNAAQETFKTGFATRSASTVARIEPVRNVVLRDFRVENDGGCLEVVRFKYAEDCLASGITATVSAVYADTPSPFKMNLARRCLFRRCKHVSSGAAAGRIASLERVYANYSSFNHFKLISSQDCACEDCSDNGSTHAFSVTYGDGSIPSIRCRVTGCTSVNSVWAGVIAQQNTPWTTLSGNTVRGSSQGVMAAGRWTVIRDNLVETDLPYATNHYYAHVSRGGTGGIGVFEGYARDCEISGNRIRGFRTGILVLDGYERLNIFDGPVCLRVEDNIVEACVNGFMVSRNAYDTGTVDGDITLENNSFSAASSEEETHAVILGGLQGVHLAGNRFSGFKYDTVF